MERERRAQAERIHIAAPGVLRGFDAMHLTRSGQNLSVFVAADGCVPYRTAATTAERYDAPAVGALLEHDVKANGRPLVVRLDRAKQHTTAAIREMLEAEQIILLQVPPYRAQYYGQLERQNREHRAWLAVEETRDVDELDERVARMISVLNTRWRRSTLGWKTAAEVWAARPELDVDRRALREEVKDRMDRLRRVIAQNGGPNHLAERLAIEQVLERRGLLSREVGGWC
jgi:hypothetical protein